MAEEYANEVLKASLEVFFNPYLEAYRERVNTLYFDEHKESSSFQYMKPVKLTVLLRGENTHLIFSSDFKDNISFIECSKMESKVFQQLSSSSSKVKDSFIKSISGLEKYLFELHYSQLGEYAGIAFSTGNRGSLSEQSKILGIEEADNHFSGYELEKALEKVITPNTTLTIVNTDEILERVNDSSFQYEFGESAKAYSAGMYLAAAATGGMRKGACA